MALFPTTIGVGYDTNFEPNAGKKAESAEDGSIVVINYFSNVTYEGVIVIPFATAAERATINTFYADNKNVVWTFEHPGDGHTYSLYFLNAPSETRLETHGDARYKITMSVVGTR